MHSVLHPQACPAPDDGAHAVAEAAIRAYASVRALPPFTALPYDVAREHTSGDPLAEFLVVEITEGTVGDSVADRLASATARIDVAIGYLAHVRDRLRERAGASACIPLPLPDPWRPRGRT